MFLGTLHFSRKGQNKPKRLENASKSSQKEGGIQDLPWPAMKGRFFSTEIGGFGHPSILTEKGQESPRKPQEPPKGFKKASKNPKGPRGRKGFKKLSKGRGIQDLPWPAMKRKDFLVLKSMVLGWVVLCTNHGPKTLVHWYIGSLVLWFVAALALAVNPKPSVYVCICVV